MNKYVNLVLSLIILIAAIIIPNDSSQPKVGKGNGKNEQIEDLEAFSTLLSSLSLGQNYIDTIEGEIDGAAGIRYKSVSISFDSAEKLFISEKYSSASGNYSLTTELKGWMYMTENAIFLTASGYINMADTDGNSASHVNYSFDYDLYHTVNPISGISYAYRFRKFEAISSVSYTETNSNSTQNNDYSNNNNYSDNNNYSNSSSSSSANKTSTSRACLKPQYYNEWLVLNEQDSSISFSELDSIIDSTYSLINKCGEVFHALDENTISNRKELTLTGDNFKDLALQLLIRDLGSSIEEKDITGGNMHLSVKQKESPEMKYTMSIKRKESENSSSINMSAEVSENLVFTNINNTIIENIDLVDAANISDAIWRSNNEQ